MRIMANNLKYKSVLLKVSGEALMGDTEFGIDPKTVDRIASDIKQGIDWAQRLVL